MPDFDIPDIQQIIENKDKSRIEILFQGCGCCTFNDSIEEFAARPNALEKLNKFRTSLQNQLIWIETIETILKKK